MNGRIYDPVLGRFMTADQIIDGLFSTQGLNRYGYVHNNPLAYTDPLGLFSLGKFFRTALAIAVIVIFQQYELIPAAFAADIGMSAAMLNGIVGGAIAGGIMGGDLSSVFVGAITGGMFGAFGDLAKGANFMSEKFLASVIGRSAMGCISALAGGGRCAPGAMSAGFAAFAGPLIPVEAGFVGRVIAGAVIGGTASAIGGGKFANGAITGAFAAALSEAMVARGDPAAGSAAGTGTEQGATAARNGTLLNLAGSDDPFGANLNRVPPDPDGRFIVGAHGNEFALALGGPNGIQITPTEAAHIIKSYQSYTGQDVLLLACNTGASPMGFAQQLANALQSIIIAPDSLVWVYSSGAYVVAPSTMAPPNELSGRPDLSRPGKWITFRPQGAE